MSENSSLQIGQIIYILSNKAQTVVPAIVIEEVIVKKINGNLISWKVAIGPKDNNRIVDSNKLNGEIFHSLEEVKQVLLGRFTDFVNSLCDETEKRSENWYGKSKQLETTNSDSMIDPENIVSSIENGNKMINQKENIQQNNVFFTKTPLEQQRERLRAMVSSEETEDESADINKQMVRMPGPDGKEMIVSVKIPS